MNGFILQGFEALEYKLGPMITELYKAVAKEEGREIEDEDVGMNGAGMNGDAAPLVQSYGAGMNGSYGYGGGNADPYGNGAGGSYMNGGGMPYR